MIVIISRFLFKLRHKLEVKFKIKIKIYGMRMRIWKGEKSG